eukprot:353241-Chlamydomonas_euryale.AAC.8
MERKRPPAGMGGGANSGGYGAQGSGSGSGPGGGPPHKRGPGMTEEDMIIADAMDDFDPDEDAMQPPDEDAAEVDLGEAGRNWMRPAVPEFDPRQASLGTNGSMHTRMQAVCTRARRACMRA